MAMAERITGPFMEMGSGDNTMDDKTLIKEQEERDRILGAPTRPVKRGLEQVAGTAEKRLVSEADALKAHLGASTSPTITSSLRYDINTLFRLAAVQPPLPVHQLKFTEDAPTEVIRWKAFEPRYLTMAPYSASLISSDDDGNCGVPLSTPPTVHTHYVPFNGASSYQQVIRQPINAPAGLEEMTKQGFKKGEAPAVVVQQFEGFARFIKTHASPPHTRVTAGGRVVPVGPKSPPPTFHMGFIDRLLQAAEEAKQDPSKTNQQCENWLEGFGSEIESVPEQAAVASHHTRNQSHSMASQVSVQGMNKHERKCGKLEIPEHFKSLADMADGSKIVTVGKAFLRAFLIKSGTTAFETLQATPQEKPPVLKSPTPVAAPHVAPASNTNNSMMTVAGKPFMLIQGPNGSWVSAVPCIDESGHIQYSQCGPAVYSVQPTQLAPAAPASIANHHNGGRVRTSLSHAPSALSPYGSDLIKMPPRAPQTIQTLATPQDIALRDMSSNELLDTLRSTISFHELKKNRLDKVERSLAKDLETMSEFTKNELVREKGELIRVCDSIRKEKEKIESALRERGFTLETGKSTQSTFGQQYHYPSQTSVVAPGPQPIYQHGPAASTSRFYSQPPAIHHMQDMVYHQQPLTAMDVSRSQPSMLQMLGNRSLKPDAPNFVPTTGSQESLGSFENAPRAAKSSMYMNGKLESSSKLALVQVHRSNSSDAGINAPRTTFSGKQLQRVNSKITLRHPDGTPLDLAAISGKNRGKLAKAQSGSDSSSFNVRQNSASPVKNATNSASSRSDSPPDVQLKSTWSKLPGESDTDYEMRTQHQRRSAGTPLDNNTVPKTSAPGQTTQIALPNGLYTNENLQFLKPPVHNIAQKPPPPGALSTQRQTTTHQAPARVQLQHTQGMAYGTHHGYACARGHYQNAPGQAQYRSSGMLPLPRGINSTASQRDLNAHHHTQIRYQQPSHVVTYPSSENLAGGYYVHEAPSSAANHFSQYRSAHGRNSPRH